MSQSLLPNCSANDSQPNTLLTLNNADVPKIKVELEGESIKREIVDENIDPPCLIPYETDIFEKTLAEADNFVKIEPFVEYPDNEAVIGCTVKNEKAGNNLCVDQRLAVMYFKECFKKTLYVPLTRLNLDAFVDEENQMRLQEALQEAKQHKCHMCPYSTPRRYRFNRHLATHMTLKDYAKTSTLYECPNCNYKTKCKWSLKRHLIKLHKSAHDSLRAESSPPHVDTNHSDDVQVYNCEKCSFSSGTKPELKYHSRTHDLSEVFLKCMECEFQTQESKCLDKHVLSHTNMRVGKLYKCGVCPYETKKKSSITRHMVSHSKVKEHRCTECNFKTMRKNSLMFHMRVHQPKQDKLVG